MHETAELDLIANGRLGDQEAMSELFGRHYPSSLRLARGILRSEDESQDAVQLAYISAFQHLHSFRGDACFKTWITRIVVNSCLMYLRQPVRRVTWVPVEDLPGGSDLLTCPAPGPEKLTWSQEINSAFSVAISTLPKSLRDVYTLYTEAGMSLKEVAATLGLTLSATKTRLFRARAGVRMHLQPLWSREPAQGAARRRRTLCPAT